MLSPLRIAVIVINWHVRRRICTSRRTCRRLRRNEFYCASTTCLWGVRIVTYGGGGAATHHHRLALLNGAAVRPGGAAAKLSTTCGECAVAGEGVSKS